MLLIPNSMTRLASFLDSRVAYLVEPKTFFCISILALVGSTLNPALVVADNTEVITIEGLSLPCSGCQVDTNEQCLIRAKPGADAVLTPCASALDTLLQGLADSPTATPTVSISQLRSFLIGNTQTSNRALSSFRILLQTTDGESAVRDSAAILYSKYPEELTAAIRSGAGSDKLLGTLWELPATSGIQINGTLKAVIAHRDSTLTTDDLIDSLPLADINADLKELEQIRSTLASLGGQDEAASIAQMSQALRTCADISEDATPCNPEVVAHLSDSAQRYLSRAKVAQVLAASGNSKITPAERLSLVASTDYKHFRTPDLLSVVLDAVRSITRADNPEARVSLLSFANRTLLAFFAENDPSIAQAYGALLIKSADEAIEQNDFYLGISFLEESFNVYPTESDVRNSIITNAHLVAGVAENPELRARRSALEERMRGEGKTPVVIIGAALVFGIIGVGLLAIAVKLRTKTLESQGVIPPSLTVIERAQLRELLSTFGLPGNASEEQLTKAYRLKARELHPDTGAGATDDFTQLTERYKKARDLIATRDIA